MEDEIKIVTARTAPEKKALAQEFRRNMTPTERKLWVHLRAGLLQGIHFRRQQVIAGFIADFYCHSARLVIEIDGAVHADRVEYDAERDKVLAIHNLRILRIPANEVDANIKAVLNKIIAAIRQPN